MKTPVIQVFDLNYAYQNNKTALSKINLAVFEGEKIAVLGSNGAGKSTFFLILNGVLTPESGKIYYRGQEITKKNKSELRKKIGIVFQEADNQIIASTVLAEVSFGPMNLKLPKDEIKHRVDEALNYMNITEFKERPPHYLSGGEKKKVSIADIIAMKSEVIIFDEPTASLDPLNTAMLENVLSKLSKENKTLIISTHDVDFAYRWAERIIVFSNGSIIADDVPLNVFCNSKIIKDANLKRPILLDVYEAMVEKKFIENGKLYPKNIDEFKNMLI